VEEPTNLFKKQRLHINVMFWYFGKVCEDSDYTIITSTLVIQLAAIVHQQYVICKYELADAIMGE